MNRLTVRRLLGIQCEQTRSHDIDVGGPIGVFEKKRNRILSFLSYSCCFFYQSGKIPCERQKKSEKILFIHLELRQTIIFYFLSYQKKHVSLASLKRMCVL